MTTTTARKWTRDGAGDYRNQNYPNLVIRQAANSTVQPWHVIRMRKPAGFETLGRYSRLRDAKYAVIDYGPRWSK